MLVSTDHVRFEVTLTMSPTCRLASVIAASVLRQVLPLDHDCVGGDELVVSKSCTIRLGGGRTLTSWRSGVPVVR